MSGCWRQFRLAPLFPRRHVNVHGLYAYSSRAGEAVAHDLRGAGEQAGGEFLELGFHLHRAVFVDPAAGLDVNLFAGSQCHVENVAVSVHPHDPFARLRDEMVDEKPRPTHQHWKRPLPA